MTIHRATLLVVLSGLTGCPSNNTNAPVLWLAPDQNETHVKLVESEPNTF